MRMTKTAYIDFDGTIVDVFSRFHGILSEYLKEITYQSLDFENYQKLKKDGNKDHIIVRELLGVEIDIDDYLKFKRKSLEDISWLKKDRIIGNPKKSIHTLKEMGYKVVLLTQRNNRVSLEKQLDYLKMSFLFDDVVIVKPKVGYNVKYEYIKTDYSPSDLIIGDSKVEYDTARLLDIKGFFVETGLFSAESLNIHELVFDNYETVIDYISIIEKEGNFDYGI